MKLGKSAVFVSQLAIIHGLIAYHALAGDTVDRAAEIETNVQAPKTTVVSVSHTTKKNSQSKAVLPRTTPQAQTGKPKSPAGLKALAPGALRISAIYEEDGQMLADLDNGWSAETTLDPWLNGRAEYYLKRGKVPMGAVVVLDLPSGDVLALADRFVADHPATQGIDRAGPPSLALRNVAPAASIFKILSSAALLDNGLDPYQEFPFVYAKRGLSARHLKKSIPGAARTSLGTALATSNNGFFGRVTDARLTRDDFAKYVNRFGFNKVIPFPILTDASTVRVPRNRLERARMSAGFGHSDMTTLHAALIAAAVAGDGHLVRPRLVSRLHGPKGQVIDSPIREPMGTAMRPGTARILKQIMAKTIKRGTARKSFSKWPKRLKHIRVGGKTGTLSRRSPTLTAYTWFVGYAPVDNPEVAIAVMVGNGEKWWQRAVDIARDILAAHFIRKAKRTVATRSKSQIKGTAR
jgi:peptidoglycan glycosyltransferase